LDFRHAFEVRASLLAVRDFHARAASLRALTPALMPMQLLQAPADLSPGSTMTFRLWLGPLPIRWTARIEDRGPEGFTDRQLSGPFAEWVHRHTFDRRGEAATLIRDHIQARLRPHLVWGPIGLAIWIGTPLLFAFRARKTRQLLERSA
jgi:ligand-binding SRPBCC domain-containing protein